TPARVLDRDLFIFPAVYISICLFGDLCFDQLGHLVVGQVVKIIPAGHVDEHAIPLDEGSEASLAFSDRFSLELADRSIGGLLCLYILDGFLSVDGGEIGAPRDRDKLVAPFNIGTEAADA